MFELDGQGALLVEVVAEERPRAEQAAIAHRFHLQLRGVVFERDVGAAHLPPAADFDRDGEALPESLSDGLRRKAEAHRRVRVNAIRLRRLAASVWFLFSLSIQLDDAFLVDRGVNLSLFRKRWGVGCPRRQAVNQPTSAGIGARLSRRRRERARSRPGVEADRLRNLVRPLVVEIRWLRRRRRTARVGRAGTLPFGDQALLLLLLDLGAVERVFDALVHAPHLRRPDARQVIIWSDACGADYVRCDSDDNVGLAGLLTRGGEEPADQREHPEHRQ